ncbi:MAG: CPBP family intramembrane glutamic endopeptidase [Bacteroidia bacterium]
MLVYVFSIAPLLALAVHYLASFINQNVFSAHNSIYYNAYLDSPSPLFFSILSIGVFPALFEEIAFRGILFNETLKVTSLKSTILITSILFTLLHFSLISSIWLFPGGLIFGYLRAKHKTLLYGVLGHFTYNSSVVLLQILLS